MNEFEFNCLVKNIERVINDKGRCILAIEGQPCSGKTTLAEKLSKKIESNVIHIDDFYLKKGMKNNLLESNDGNIDFDRLKREVIDKLNDEEFEYGIFSCKEQKIVSRNKISSKPLIIVEGSYSTNPLLGNYFDYAIYLDIDDEILMKRLKGRMNIDYDNFIKVWVFLEKKYCNFYEIKKRVNKVINNN